MSDVRRLRGGGRWDEALLERGAVLAREHGDANLVSYVVRHLGAFAERVGATPFLERIAAVENALA